MALGPDDFVIDKDRKKKHMAATVPDRQEIGK